jgi:hypothetical protein
VGHQVFNIPKSQLDSSVKPGVRLILQLSEGQVIGVAVDEEATEEAKERIKNKYERLRGRARSKNR